LSVININKTIRWLWSISNNTKITTFHWLYTATAFLATKTIILDWRAVEYYTQWLWICGCAQ